MTGGSSVQVVNRERLSGKVHATIPKGIVGGFEGTVLQRNREATDICLRVLKESNKSRFDEVRQLQSFDHIPYYLVSRCFDRINEISGGHEKGLVLEN